MSKISIYDVVPVPKLADKLVGTSVGGDPEDLTYNFTLGDLLNLFIPNIPGNTLQGVLDFGNTATQNINLTGTVNTTNLTVSATANILNSNLTGQTHITGGVFDRLNSIGTAGQVLTSTGTQVEWYTIPTIIPNLQQVLTAGNTAVNNIILTGNITANNAALLTATISTSLTLLGTVKDGLSSVGTINQVLSSNGTGVRWINLPVYSATSPLLYNSATGVFSIQQANASQSGYLSSADWITFDGKQTAIILTTTGSSGPSTLVGATINIPNYTLAGLNGVPQTRTLTINGVTFNLSADRSWTIATGVSSVTASSPLFSTGGATPNITIQQSSSTLDGYLSSVDWLTFNSKQALLGGTGLVKSVGGTISYITDNSANWNTAYNDSIVSAAVTGTATKLLTLNQQDGGTITASWSDIDTGLTSVGVSMPAAFTVTNSPLTSNGTIAITGSGNALQYIDGTGALQTFPGLTGFVPYTGATGSVNLGVYSLTATSLIKNGGTSGQFLKADGSVDSSAYIVLGSLSASAPLSYNNLTGAFSIIQSGTVTDGYLSSTDWNTFNNKQGALTLTTTGTSGASTLIGNTLNIPQYTDQFVGTVTSVGLTMPAAFTVSNSPVTSAGTLAVVGAGLASQYVRGDGSLGDFPGGGGGGGSSVSYYLNGSVNQGTFVGNTYYEMSKVPVFGAGTDFNIATNGYISQFITDANDPESLLIPAGNWNFETYFSASSAGGSPTFYVELYKYDGTTFTLIADNSATPELISFGTNIEPYFSSVAVPETVLTITDRLAIRVYVNNSGRTITLHTEDSHLCQIVTTFTTGLTTLNGLTTQVQYFSTGTSGADFNISSAVATHTFNLPTASAVNRGALSSADWTTFDSKQPAGNYVTTDTTQTITALKTILRGGDVLNFKIGVDTLYGLKIAYNQNELVPSGEATWSFVNTFNNGIGTGLETTPISFFRGVLVTGERLLSVSVNSNLLSYYGNNPSGRYPIYAYNTGVQQFQDSILVGFNTGVVNAVTGAIASLPAGVVANFNGRVIGSNAVNSNEFATLGQITGGTVTSVGLTSVTSGVTIGSTPITTSGNITIAIATATASQNGLLSSTDWTTFNSKQGAITLTTTGTSGASTLVGNTLNIPNYTDSFVGTVTSVSFTLGSTGTNLSASVATSTTTPAITLNVPTASASARGALSSTDWSTFNSKQDAITLTTTGTSGAATLVGATLNIPSYTDQFVGTVTSVAATAGTGISVSGSPITTSGTLTITNTAPDQVVALTPSTGIAISGTYPNFTITNTSPSSGGTVTSVTGTSPIVSSGGTTPAISIPVATTSVNGYLSSTDWTTFNNKQNALTNPVTGTGTTNYLAKFTGTSTVGDSAFYDGGGFGGFNSTGLGSRTFVVNAASGRPLVFEMIEFANIHSVYVRPNNSGFNLISSNYISGGVYLPLSLSARENNADLVLQTGGNITIGTTTDGGAKLQVISSGIALNIATSNGQIANINSTNANGGYITWQTSGTTIADLGTAQQIFGAGGNDTFGINARGARSLILGTNDTARLTIASTGAATFTAATQDAIQTVVRMSGNNASSQLKALDFKLTAGTPLWTISTAAIGTDAGINIMPNGNAGLSLTYAGAATFSSTVQAGGEITTGSLSRAFLRQTAGGDAELGCKTGGTTSIFSNGTAALTLSPTGAATFSGALNGTSATFSGAVAVTIGGAGISLTGTVGSNSYYVMDQTPNSGKRWRFGHTGAIGGYGSFDFYNQTDNITPLTISSTGAATFSSSVSIPSISGLILGQTAVTDGIISSVSNTVGLNFKIGATSALYISGSSSPDVGIGTTNPAGQLSGTKGLSIVNATNAAVGLSNGTNHWLNYLSGTTYRIWNNSVSEVMTFTLGGNVGIGTASPLTKLNVVGGTSSYVSTADSAYGIIIQDPTSMTANVGGSLLFQGYKTGTSAIGNFGFITGRKENGTAGNEAGFLGLGTFDSAGGGYERMRITSGGNVLIGTTTDNGYKLNVNGDIRTNAILYTNDNGPSIYQNRINAGWNTIGDSIDLWINYEGYLNSTSYFRDFRVGNGKQGASILFIDGSAGTSTFSGGVTIQGGNSLVVNNASNTRSGYLQTSPTGTELSSFAGAGEPLILIAPDTTATIRFYTGGSTVANERMRITSGGNLLVGTTTSTGATLEINGSIRTGVLDTGYVSGVWRLGRAVIGTQPTNTHQIIVEINGALYVIPAASL